MGTVITVMNMKGGVGKTTVTAHVAGVLGRFTFDRQPKKVLMIDYDPQFNLSQAFLPAKVYFDLEKNHRTSLAILQDAQAILNPYDIQLPGSEAPPSVATLSHRIYKYAHSHLDLVPSTLNLMYLALGQSEKRTTRFDERFATFIAECRRNYDIVFIDCHPAGSILTKTSLQNSDHVLIPVSPQRYAIRGVGLMMDFIAAKRQGTPGPTPHILFNAVPRTGITEEETIIRKDPRYTDKCLTHTMKRFGVFSEPIEGNGFAWSSGKPWNTVALRNLWSICAELLGRIGLGAKK